LDFLFDLEIRKDCTPGLPSDTLVESCSRGPLGERSQRQSGPWSELLSLVLKEYQQQTIEEGSVGNNLEAATMMLLLRLNIG
jgi:hypothetical protein